jgi:hypothetical protein
VSKEYVGIDLHRRRSVIYRMDEAGQEISCVRIPSQPDELTAAMSQVPLGTDVVVVVVSSPPMAGTGRRTCSKGSATPCTCPTPTATTGGTAESSLKERVPSSPRWALEVGATRSACKPPERS